MQQSSRGDMVIYYTDNVFADRMETRLKLHNRIENMHGHSKMDKNVWQCSPAKYHRLNL